MKTECLVTGVELLMPDGTYFAHGDLFQHGDTFIVNAVTDSTGDAVMLPANELHAQSLTFQLTNVNYFERRGVFVFNSSDCSISLRAFAYIRKWHPEFMKGLS